MKILLMAGLAILLAACSSTPYQITQNPSPQIEKYPNRIDREYGFCSRLCNSDDPHNHATGERLCGCEVDISDSLRNSLAYHLDPILIGTTEEERFQNLWSWFNTFTTYQHDLLRMGYLEYWDSMSIDLTRALDTHQFPRLYGDCEDYALAMADMLISIGVDPGRIFLVAVRTSLAVPGASADHAVLWVKMDDGYLVFDSNREFSTYYAGSSGSPSYKAVEAIPFPLERKGWLDISGSGSYIRMVYR